MYARVVTFTGQPNKLQDGLRKLEEDIPALRKFSGFQDIYCLTDHQTGKCIVVALWESERALQNASTGVKSIRDEVTRAFGSKEEAKVEVYEVGYGPGQAARKAA